MNTKKSKSSSLCFLFAIMLFFTILIPDVKVSAKTINYSYGNIGDGDTRTKSWSTSSNNDVTWFKFSTGVGIGFVEFSLTGKDTDGNIALYSSNKSMKSSTTHISNGGVARYAVDSFKTYYVKVTNIKGKSSLKMKVVLGGGNYINSSKDTAKKLSNSMFSEVYNDSSDKSWYTFYLSKKDKVDLSVVGAYINSGEIKISLIKMDGSVVKTKTLSASKSQVNKVIMDNVSLSKGEYYVKVESVSSLSNASLGLKVGY